MAFDFKKVKESIERISSEGFLEHPRFREFEQIANGSLERCDLKIGWKWMYQNENIRQTNLRHLTNLLVLSDGDINEWRVMDLGCGAPEDYSGDTNYHHKGYLPYKAEVLSDLGAKVVGVDFRQNSNASYEHRVVNFGEFYNQYDGGDLGNEDRAKEKLNGNFDLVIGTSLTIGGLTKDSDGYDTLAYLLGVCAKPSQVQFFDPLFIPYLSSGTKDRFIRRLRKLGINLMVVRGNSIGIKE